jgi:hypothetical protein
VGGKKISVTEAIVHRKKFPSQGRTVGHHLAQIHRAPRARAGSRRDPRRKKKIVLTRGGSQRRFRQSHASMPPKTAKERLAASRPAATSAAALQDVREADRESAQARKDQVYDGLRRNARTNQHKKRRNLVEQQVAAIATRHERVATPPIFPRVFARARLWIRSRFDLAAVTVTVTATVVVVVTVVVTVAVAVVVVTVAVALC